MLFRQLFDLASSTYTYLLADRGVAVLIDPVFEQVSRDAALVRELGLKLAATIDTHIHADHVTGAWLHHERFASEIVVSAASGATAASRTIAHGDRIAFGDRSLGVRATPGHTSGCVTLVLDDETHAFTGDCLLVRASGRTDLQGGDPHVLHRSVTQQIWTLPAACLLYPAHDYRGLTVTSVDEERRHNPRLGGDASESDFVGYATNLGLPHPRAIDHAVPANLACGRPPAGTAPAEPTWARLTYAFAGFWQIAPDALEELGDAVLILDVRDPEELRGELGMIPGARAIPLSELDRRIDEVSRDKPIVTVCRSGARSARAAIILEKSGRKAANLQGGMLRWRDERRCD
jgi:sulfur dioxygenase